MSKLIVLLILFGINLISGGCSEQAVSEPSISRIRVEGFVYKNDDITDIFNSGSPVDMAEVDLYQVSQSGLLTKLNENSAVTDSKGNYQMEAQVHGNTPYIIAARKNDLYWKGVICTSVNKDITVFAQPLTASSTAQSVVFQSSLKKGYNIPLYDITLLINEELAEAVNSNEDVTEQVIQMLDNLYKARSSAFTNAYFGGTSEGLQKFYMSSEETSLLFSRDLYFSAAATNIDVLLDSYYQSYIDLLIDSGISKEKVLKLIEITYRVLIKSGNLDDETNFKIIKNAAYLKAKVFNSSILSDFKSLQGTSQINNIKIAAKDLNYSIVAATNYDKIRDSFQQYNNIVIENLSKAVGINNGLKNAIEQKILEDRTIFYSQLNASIDSQSIISAYVNYYSSLSPELKNLLKNMYSEDSETLAEMMVLLYINV